MRQGQREMTWRIRKAHDIAIYLATAANVETITVTPDQEAAYRQASARHHTKPLWITKWL